MLFFVERLDGLAFVEQCTRRFGARAVDDDLRWKTDDATVWARDVSEVLAGGFVVTERVTKCLEATPQSAILLEVGDEPGSGHLGFLVIAALLGRWSGCATTAGDAVVLSSRTLTETSSSELALRQFCERGGHG
jgi:hypothetical protein